MKKNSLNTEKRSMTPLTFIHKNIAQAKHSPRNKIVQENLSYQNEND